MEKLGHNKREQSRSPRCGNASGKNIYRCEASQCTQTDKHSAENYLLHETVRKKAFVRSARRLFHVLLFGRLNSQRNSGKSVGNKIYQKYLSWKKHHRHTHDYSQKHCQYLADIAA